MAASALRFLEPDCPTWDDHGGRVYQYRQQKYRSVTSVLKCLEEPGIWEKRGRPFNERNEIFDYTFDEYKDDAALAGSYFHYRAGCDLARPAGLPLPKFEPTRPIPEVNWINNKGEMLNRVETFLIAMKYWRIFKSICHPRAVGTGVERFVYHPSGYGGRVDSVMSLDVEHWRSRVWQYGDHFNFLDKNGSFRQDDVWLVDFKTSREIQPEHHAQVWAYFKAWNYLMPVKCNRIAILRCNGETGWEFTETAGDPVLWDKAMEEAQTKQILFDS